jgi:hypothetical protein
MRCAVIDLSNNNVINIVMVEQATGSNMIPSDSADIGYVYDSVTGTFSCPNTETLEEVRLKKLNALGSYLTAAQNAGAIYNGNVFATDESSQIKYLGIMMYATMDSAYETAFKTVDKQYVILKNQDVIGLCNTVKQHIQLCFINDAQLTHRIQTASTIEELNAIDITQGWPNLSFL